MKTWQKIISAVLVVVLIGAAVWYFFQEQKDCCLCSSFRYHAPCLIDLETGQMIELDLYFPHETKVAEYSDAPEPGVRRMRATIPVGQSQYSGQ